jgi:hypothetical protein
MDGGWNKLFADAFEPHGSLFDPDDVTQSVAWMRGVFQRMPELWQDVLTQEYNLDGQGASTDDFVRRYGISVRRIVAIRQRALGTLQQRACLIIASEPGRTFLQINDDSEELLNRLLELLTQGQIAVQLYTSLETALTGRSPRTGGVTDRIRGMSLDQFTAELVRREGGLLVATGCLGPVRLAELRSIFCEQALEVGR